MRIEIVSGSPREKSSTRRIAIYLQKFFTENGHDAGFLSVRDFPLPFVDQVISSVEAAPEEFKPLAQRIFSADAFVLVTPEYNGSYSPALQNMFDFFPKQQRKPFGLVTGSPGALGGIRAAMQMQQFVMALFGIPSPYMLVIPAIEKKFDAEGNLVDPAFQKSIDTFYHEFLWLTEKLVPEKVPA